MRERFKTLTRNASLRLQNLVGVEAKKEKAPPSPTNTALDDGDAWFARLNEALDAIIQIQENAPLPEGLQKSLSLYFDAFFSDITAGSTGTNKLYTTPGESNPLLSRLFKIGAPAVEAFVSAIPATLSSEAWGMLCLLYTSDAADEE